MVSNKYIDFKMTVWFRAHLDDDTNMSKMIEILKNKGDSSDICDEDLGFLEWEELTETELQLSPEQNEGDATIEVYDDTVKIWKNTDK